MTYAAPPRLHPDEKPILEMRDLCIDFGAGKSARRVVDGVSFAISDRQTVALVGESGSGKSVTALAAMRLIGADEGARLSGQALFQGRDLLTLSEREMERVRGNEISMIFQEPMTSLNPIMSAGDQLAETLMRHRGLGRRAARAEAIAMFDRVRIPAAARRYDDYPHSMSGGMRQRVMIAMALACRPKLLIADEPTTALDVTVQAQILDLIKELQDEEGMGVLFITHDMGVVAEIADRTVVMLRGHAVEQGETAAIFSAPRQPYTRALLSAVPELGSMRDEPLPRRFDIVDAETGLRQPAPAGQDTVRHDAPPVLDVIHLTTRFDIRSGLMRRVTGRVHAVEDVSFSLNAGETLALVGESGCGKSTTGRSLIGLTRPVSGRVLSEGQDILTLPKEDARRALRDLQMIFQDPFASLDPRQTVATLIAEPMLVHGVGDTASRAAKVGELLRLVGLDEAVAHRYPHEFSGGQRQRICIARALALEPRVLIADESVSALDVSVKAQVLNLMIGLQERLGLSYLFISHDMAVVERISHRVAVMYLGEIVEIGPRAAIFSDPQHPYTKRLLSAVPVPDPARRGLRKRAPAGEIGSPIRPADHDVPARRYRTVAPGHLVAESREGDGPLFT